jgi:hypothetical protein
LKERKLEPQRHEGHEEENVVARPSDEGTRAAPLQNTVQRGFWLAVMVALGIGLGAVQFIPLYEFANMNFRVGSASFDQVLSWAHPPRDVIQFAVPNFYGSPSDHSYFDVFTGQTVSLIDTIVTNAAGQRIVHTEWGMKNYVEGALYVGVLPIALAVFALVAGRVTRAAYSDGEKIGRRIPLPPYRLIFAILGLFSLTFMFGLPTYAILYVLPGVDQLHSPFRWVFGLTLSVAVLAGFGMDALVQMVRERTRYIVSLRWARIFGYTLSTLSVIVFVGLLLSRIFYTQIEPLIQRLLDNMATPNGGVVGDVFVTPQMFYSYQFPNFLILGLVLLGSGTVFLWTTKSPSPPAPLPPSGERGESMVASPSPRLHRVWGEGYKFFAVALIAVDLMIASWGFNPSSDPTWLDFTPPAIVWLQEQPGEWRYTTVVDRYAPNPDLFKPI